MIGSPSEVRTVPGGTGDLAKPAAPPARRPMHRDPAALLLGFLWAAAAVLGVLRVDGFALDDFFITYRYAWNLLAGDGFVFNPGERVFGTTAPGMGLLVAAVSTVTRLPIPHAAPWVTGVALWSLAWLLLAEGRERGRTAEAAAAGTLIVTSSFLWVHVGAEGPVALALLLGAARAAGHRPVLAGLLAGFAVWCRPDAGLGVAALGLLLWRERGRLPWRFGIAGGAAIAAGLAAARWWFGRWLPGTLEAKRLQAEWMPEIWAGGLTFWGEGLRSLRTLYVGPGVMLLVVLGLAGLVSLVVLGGRAHRLLAAYALALAVAYPLLGVAYYAWYAIPIVIGLLAGAAYACGWVARRAYRFCGGTAAGRWVAAAALLLLAVPLGGELARRSAGLYLAPGTSPRYELYRHVGGWLRENAPAGEAVSYVEVGMIGYYSRRPVRDLLGLVTPDAIPWVERGDLVDGFLAAPTPWIIYDTALHGFMQPLRDAPWFEGAYREVVHFRHPGNGEELILYRRRPGAELPPPDAPSAPTAAAEASSASGASAAETR